MAEPSYMHLWSELEVDYWARIAQDTKKEFHYSKDLGKWYWSDRTTAENPDEWQGPFDHFLECLRDAVEPYLGDEDD